MESHGRFRSTSRTPKKRGENPKKRFGVKKPPLELVSSAAIVHESLAMRSGGITYGPYNWRKNAVESMTYIAAALRHLRAYLDGEEVSRDNGVHHLGAVRACCGIVLDAREAGDLVDNRPRAGRAGAFMERVTAALESVPRDLEHTCRESGKKACEACAAEAEVLAAVLSVPTNKA